MNLEIRLRPTPSIVERDGVPCRLWAGRTNGGEPVTAFVQGVGSNTREGQRALEAALKEVTTEIESDVKNSLETVVLALLATFLGELPGGIKVLIPYVLFHLKNAEALPTKERLEVIAGLQEVLKELRGELAIGMLLAAIAGAHNVQLSDLDESNPPPGFQGGAS
jgi:hypothetical protein